MYIYFTISFLRNTGARAALDDGRWFNRCHARKSGHRATLGGVGFPLPREWQDDRLRFHL